MDSPTSDLTAAQAAARLGIRTESLYAYVSRGMLSRRRTAHGSLFDAIEIERFALARRRRSPASDGPAPVAGSDGRPLGVIDTDISLIEDGRLYFRGRDSTVLAGEATFDAVVRWLLDGGDAPAADAAPLVAVAEAARAAADAVASLPADAPAFSRLVTAVAALAASDPLRFDLREGAHATALRLIPGLVDALPLLGQAPAPNGALAGRLWPRLTKLSASTASIRALDAALVLLVDHDMAASTVAARAAASARAHPYAVVAAGLGALDSAAHGAASAPVHTMLLDAASSGRAERAVADGARRTAYGVPGFGQPLYPAGDPRARALMAALRSAAAGAPSATGVLRAADAVAALVTRRTGAHPSVDFALGAMTAAFDMAPDAGEVVFAVGRSAGWCSHAIAEYAMPALRLRPVGRYTGPYPAVDQPGSQVRG